MLNTPQEHVESAHINEPLMRDAIEALEEWLEANHMSIDPKDKPTAVFALYNRAIELREDNLNDSDVLDFVKVLAKKRA